MKYLKLLIVIPIILCFCSCSVKQKPREIKGDPKLPKETNVVFHFSTGIDPYTASKNKLENGGYSQIHYFDKSGDDIGNFSVNKEKNGDFMVEQDDELVYFYSNFSVKSTNTKYDIIEKQTDITMGEVRQSPNKVGRIPNKNMSYALFNVGSISTRKTYVKTLRIIDGTQSYDIEIPYYVPYISYDESSDSFLFQCEYFDSNGNSLFNKFNYGRISFDKQSNRYVLEDEIKSIAYTDKIYNDDNRMIGSEFYIKDNIVYKYIADEPKEDLTDKNGDLLSFEELGEKHNSKKRRNVLILLKIDLTTEKMEYTQVVEPFFVNDRGHAVQSCCSDDLPFTYKNESIYCFTTNQKVNIFNPKDGFKQRDFKFDFKDVYSCYNPYGLGKAKVETNFGNSIVEVEDDGTIYVGNIYKDGKLRIHKLNDNDKFELYWESKEKMPKLHKKGMSVSSFEIID